ncbi:MAG TPA: hypothetical protein VLW52_16730 [Opitutaceae bacterium]|nr:hypothetical protein [Opitutaceae bacterium]
MNNPPPVPPSDKVSAAESVKLKQAREAELKRNREIGHMLKSGSFQQHSVRRTVPHIRGR